MKALIFLFSFAFLVSCSKSDDPGDVVSHEFEQILTILPQGEWEVTRFYENNEDQTIDFESFTFIFEEDGSVIGKNDLFTENGNWAYKSTSENGEQLVLQFGETTPFPQIDDDWDIISLGSSKVELAKDEENETNTKLLTFSKL